MFTPKGLSVRSRILAISPFTTSSSPDEVSMMPRAPALETADASWARAIQPIGACTMGTSTPSSSVTRFEIMVIGPPRRRRGEAR
jgi:glycine cleavage system protein P-like pyridoxal-binding family